MMRAVISATVLALALAVPAAAKYADSAKHYTIEFPTGWSAPVMDKESAQSNAPGAVNAWCRANSNRMKSLDGVSQQSLNTQYGAPLDQATWASVLSIDAAKVTLVAHSSSIVDGHVVQYATLKLAPDVLGVAATARFTSHILVGRMTNAGCFAPTASFETYKATFEGVVASLKPL